MFLNEIVPTSPLLSAAPQAQSPPTNHRVTAAPRSNSSYVSKTSKSSTKRMVDGGGTRRLAEKHMAPLKELKPPNNLSELRSCLGVFVQQKKYIKDYSIIVGPLTRLTGKVPWVAWIFEDPVPSNWDKSKQPGQSSALLKQAAESGGLPSRTI